MCGLFRFRSEQFCAVTDSVSEQQRLLDTVKARKLAGHTVDFISRIFVEIGMLWLFHIFCSDAPIVCPLFNLVRNFIVHLPSSVVRDPRYGNISTCSCSSTFKVANRKGFYTHMCRVMTGSRNRNSWNYRDLEQKLHLESHETHLAFYSCDLVEHGNTGCVFIIVYLL